MLTELNHQQNIWFATITFYQNSLALLKPQISIVSDKRFQQKWMLRCQWQWPQRIQISSWYWRFFMSFQCLLLGLWHKRVHFCGCNNQSISGCCTQLGKSQQNAIRWHCRTGLMHLLYKPNDYYCKISNIKQTKSQDLNVFHPVLQLSLPSPLKPGVMLRMKM